MQLIMAKNTILK